MNCFQRREFVDKYFSLRSNDQSLNNLLEFPAVLRLVSSTLPVNNVLDLGCGFCELALAISDLGANNVIAVDSSEEMVMQAKSRIGVAEIQCFNYDISALDSKLPWNSEIRFDLVVSSLALHYIQNIELVLQWIRSLMEIDGRFIFSTDHPIVSASNLRPSSDFPVREYEGKWPTTERSENEEVKFSWLGCESVRFHRSKSFLQTSLEASGFSEIEFFEPMLVGTVSSESSENLNWATIRPPFLICSCTVK